MKITEYIFDDAIDKLRTAILTAKNNEVFFRGFTNENKKVIDIEIIARGNSFSAPAVIRDLSTGDVIIHNHPTGNLTPSEADTVISSRLGQFGIGSYIINNNASDIYVVIEPFEKESLKKIDISEIENFFSETGLLKKLFKGYEYRPQQKQMSLSATAAFNDDAISIIEASTGTGKTISYLIPAIKWSLLNKEKVVIATNTINLQEQLVNKDLPAIKKFLPLNFNYILIKGRSNYVCLNRLYRTIEQPELFDFDKKAKQLDDILEWIKVTEDGSKSSLNFIPDFGIWESVCAETDSCLRNKCKYFNECFVNKMRRDANTANILIVNHHLLLSDIIMKFSENNYQMFGVLPAFRRLIIDEAHNIDDTAVRHLGADFSAVFLNRLLSKLYFVARGKEKGMLAFARNQILFDSSVEKKEQLLQFFNDKIFRVIEDLRSELRADLAIIKNYFNCYHKKSETFKGFRIRITENIFSHNAYFEQCEAILIALAKKFGELSQNIDKCLKKFKLLTTDNEKKKEADDIIKNELTTSKNRIDFVIVCMQEFIKPTNIENTVRWVECSDSEDGNIEFYAAPIDVSNIFFDSVILPHKSILFTSATLTIDNKFDFFKKSLGLNKLASDKINELILETPFDYREQARLFVPADMPAPDAENFTDASYRFVKKILFNTERNTFLLFTSYSQLKKTLQKMRGELEDSGFNVFVQGEKARSYLLEQFRKKFKSVLFATDSFWEGVDVRGEALEIVVIFKLPFKTPDDPVVEAKTEYLTRRGHNAFREYQLPKAVIKLKQGAGRLIRTKIDNGIIVILDNRVKTKNYGRIFLNSLPEIPIIYDTSEKCLTQIEFFFNA